MTKGFDGLDRRRQAVPCPRRARRSAGRLECVGGVDLPARRERGREGSCVSRVAQTPSALERVPSVSPRKVTIDGNTEPIAMARSGCLNAQERRDCLRPRRPRALREQRRTGSNFEGLYCVGTDAPAHRRAAPSRASEEANAMVCALKELATDDVGGGEGNQAAARSETASTVLQFRSGGTDFRVRLDATSTEITSGLRGGGAACARVHVRRYAERVQLRWGGLWPSTQLIAVPSPGPWRRSGLRSRR